MSLPFVFRSLLPVVVATALGATLGSVRPAVADVLDTPLPPAAWTKTVGTMRVEKYGAGDPALILVPGLGCGSWTYRDTIAREAPHHAVYAVTLAGFDGVPYAAGDGLDSADASLATLIAQEKLVKPVLIGHSLGGFLGFRFGTEHPDLLRADVSIDGLPVYPTLASATPDDRAKAGAAFAAAVVNATQSAYDAQQAATIADLVADPALAKRVQSLVAKSDRAATAEYGKELYASDMRPDLPKLKVPALLIGPSPALPLPSYLPQAMSSMDQPTRDAGIAQYYTSMTAGAPSLSVAVVDNARHFVMLDQPDAFAKVLDAFIAAH